MEYAIILDANGNGIGAHAYAEAPTAYPANEAPCTPEQAAGPSLWMLQGGALVANPAGAWAQHQGDAHGALKAAERVALRCLALGIAYPAAWQQHATALHAIVVQAIGIPAALPTPPPDPSGV